MHRANVLGKTPAQGIQDSRATNFPAKRPVDFLLSHGFEKFNSTVICLDIVSNLRNEKGDILYKIVELTEKVQGRYNKLKFRLDPAYGNDMSLRVLLVEEYEGFCVFASDELLRVI
jgi:hypothetical protein